MTTPAPRADLSTHRVENQPPARGDTDLWASDAPLREAIAREGGQPAPLAEYGAALGTVEMRQAARDANTCSPKLHLFDAGGRRLDEVHFHPAYHQFLDLGIASGYCATAWQGTPGGHTNQAAMVYLSSKIEPPPVCR